MFAYLFFIVPLVAYYYYCKTELLRKLKRLEKLGLVRSSRHNTLPLTIWKYSAKCQYENAFDVYPELKMARGLVLHDNGNIVARGYDKFFNYAETDKHNIPKGAKNFVIETKLDGSCLLAFRYKNEVVYATLGSFNSSQAELGTRLYKELYSEDWIEKGNTYLFELIGPSNRIVNTYPEDDLILHGVLKTSNNHEVSTDKPFKKVTQHCVYGNIFGDELYNTLLNLNIPNEEGFVIKVRESGRPSWLCKIKFEDYCNLHALMSHLSPVSVWEKVVDGTFDELLEKVPDEFNTWMRNIESGLRAEYSNIESTAKKAVHEASVLELRKDKAKFILENYHYVSAVAFKMLDNRGYEELIWKMIKPENSKPVMFDLEG